MNDFREYLDYLKFNRNYSDFTIKNYSIDISMFFKYLERECLDYLDFHYNDVRFLLEYFDSLKLSSSSIRRHISSLKGFYRFLVRNNKVSDNPFNYVSLPKKNKKLPKFLNYNELIILFDSIDISDLYGLRNRMILELLYATGVRVSEIVNIKINDIDFNNNSINVFGKGRKNRVVYFNDVCKKFIVNYINDSKGVRNSEFLILNKFGNGISTRSIANILNDIIRTTSVNKNISPHVLRHTFATHLLNNGCDILSVSDLLGHESLSTTSIYTHVSKEHIRDVYYNTHPRSKM